jgi:lipopolysaccharide transport system ATP-binding protein
VTGAALSMDRVSKKFRKGELYDSLRDFLPSLVRAALRPKPADALEAREFWALRDVSFDVRPGEALGIIGANGAGKSTILKILAGIMRPTLGTMKVSGRLSALIEVGAGFHPDLTGRENIFLNGTILGMSREEIRRKFDEIVEFSGLGEFIDTPVKRYSSGMFARLGFSVAAHVDPEVLIVDEVLSVGDYVFQTKCQEKMHAILGGGATVIFVSHNLRAVTELCHRALLLEHGRVVEIGPAEQVIRSYLGSALAGRRDTDSLDAYFSRVAVRGAAGEAVSFQSGERVWVDIEGVARRDCQKLSITLFLRDEGYQDAFNTSTERLGLDTISLKAGERFACTYQLDLHLAQGTFHVGVQLIRYDVQRVYDRWIPAASLFIKTDRDARGAANLYPLVTAFGSTAGQAAEPRVGLAGGEGP